MTKVKNAKKFINRYFTKFRIYTILGVVIICLILNHLTESDNFPFGDSYDFPLASVIISIVLSAIILIIAKVNFNHFKKTYFTEKITSKSLVGFLFSTSGYISIVYLIIYVLTNWLQNGDFEFYYFFIGLSVTLLLSILLVIFVFAQSIYKLHKLETISGKISFKRGGKTFLVPYSEISYIYSEDKIVHIQKSDGDRIITDLTLNEVEDKTNAVQFFRANRQTILHHQAIEKSQAIENGKLLVTLTPGIMGKDSHEINISRYKKRNFEEWLNHKLMI